MPKSQSNKIIITPGLLWSLFCLVFLNSTAQTSTQTNTLANRQHVASKQAPLQLTYLQTSKGIYETGEDLWFKAYVLDAQQLVPSELDKSLYIQLIEEDTNAPVWEETYEIENGFVNGHVYIQDSLAVGNYRLTAYTPHSFYKDSTAFYDFRKLQIKKTILPQVKVIHQFDKPRYKKGDAITLTINLQSKQKDSLSKAIVEAELWSGNKVLSHTHTKANKHGTAHIRYKSQDTTGLTVKLRVIHLANQELIEIPVPYKAPNTIHFNVFPEGGQLISGIESQLAFKAVNYKGDPEEVSGILFEDNKPLQRFTSEHAGMGSLRFTPHKTKNYHIKLSSPVHNRIYSLPDIADDGMALQLVEQTKDNLIFNISQSSNLLKQTFYIQLQIRGVVYGIAPVEVDRTRSIRIPITNYPQGIAEVTLFNSNLEPVAERLVYVNQDQRLYIETQWLAEKYNARDKVQLRLKVTDQSGQPVVAHLAASVYDKLYHNKYAKTIQTHLYLDTQIRGRIYNPNYYFDTKNDNRSKALDLLLLTQGWRQYIWNEQNLKARPTEPKQLIFDGIKGTVSKENKKVKKAFIGALQYIQTTTPEEDNYNTFIEANTLCVFNITTEHLKTSAGGYLYLKPLKLPGASDIFKPQIVLQDPFTDINKTRTSKPLNYPRQKQEIKKLDPELTNFQLYANATALDEVIVGGKGNTVIRDKYMGKLDSLTKIRFKDYVCYANNLNCTRHKGISDPVIGQEYGFISEDGTYEKIIYSLKTYTDLELLKMNNLWRIKGFYKTKEFYHAIYDVKNIKDPFTDYRNTILWQPNIITNKQSEATLEFFSSDINADFIGVIEGLNSTSLVGHETFEFIVRKMDR